MRIRSALSFLLACFTLTTCPASSFAFDQEDVAVTAEDRHPTSETSQYIRSSRRDQVAGSADGHATIGRHLGDANDEYALEMALRNATQLLTEQIEAHAKKEDDERPCAWGLKALGGTLTFD